MSLFYIPNLRIMLKITTNTILNRLTVQTMINEGVCNRIPPKNTANQLNVMNRKKFQRILVETGVYLKEYPNKKPFLVTITTKNNSTGIDHLECKKRLSMWLELRIKQKIFTAYLWWAEIQHKNTNDIHFHIVVFSDVEKPFNIPNEVKYLNEKFPQTNTNVINIKPVKNDCTGVFHYMLAYMKKFKKSYINGKVCQLSREIKACYKANASKYINFEYHSDNIMQSIENKVIFSNEYCTQYYLHIFEKNSTDKMMNQSKEAHSRDDIRANTMSALPVNSEFYDNNLINQDVDLGDCNLINLKT